MKISFVDFWPSFDPLSNIFTDMMRFIFEDFEVVAPENANIIFSSVFGEAYKTYLNKLPILQYIGEPIVPKNEPGVTYLSTNYENSATKNFRLPLWILQFDWFFRTQGYSPENFQIPIRQLYTRRRYVKRDLFSVSIFNHDRAGNRIAYLSALKAKGIPAYAYGKPFGNWFFGERQKMHILSHFTFANCFENDTLAGYHTEKLVHAYFAGCVPLYWGSNTHSIDFNPEAYLFYREDQTMEDFVEQIIRLSYSERDMRRMVQTPLFRRPPQLIELLDPLERALSSALG